MWKILGVKYLCYCSSQVEKSNKFVVAQNIFVIQFYIEYNYISNQIKITV
jgi:hypothetical protein